MCCYAKYDTQCYRSPNINYVLYHKAVPERQEWLLYSVLYQIDHTAIPGLQEWYLYYVLYQIHHTAVAELQAMLLHNVILCCEPLQR